MSSEYEHRGARPPVDPDLISLGAHGAEPEVVPAVAFEERYANLLHEFRLQEAEAPDPIMQALFTRLNGELSGDIGLHDALRMYVRMNPEDSMSVSVRKVYSSFQQFVIPLPPHHRVLDEYGRYRDPDFPKGYDTPEGWDKVFDLLQDEEQMRRFRISLISKELQSNVISRFTPLRVAAQLYGRSVLNIYSGGASFGMIEKMERLYKPGRLRLPADVVVGTRRLDDDYLFTPDADLTADYHKLLNSPYKVEKIIAGDIDPPTDPITAIYAYSNSFRGQEFANRSYRNLVNRLLIRHIPNMHYTSGLDYGDFTSTAHIEYMRKKFPWWFELPNRKVQLVTAGHQNSAAEDERAEENARILAGDDGLILWMDFMGLGLDGKLHRKKGRWLPWDYNLYAENMADSKGKQHLFSLWDGRATTIALGEHITRLVRGRLAKPQTT